MVLYLQDDTATLIHHWYTIFVKVKKNHEFRLKVLDVSIDCRLINLHFLRTYLVRRYFLEERKRFQRHVFRLFCREAEKPPRSP
jgi:hypothetical protein